MSTLITFGEVSGSFIRSSSVATDSDLCAAQVERIEIELEVSEQRQPRGNRERGENEDGHPVTRHEAIDGSELAVADRLRLGRRLER